MKTRTLASLVAVAAFTGVAASAAAQTNGPSGFSARLGLFIPTDSSDLGTTFAGGLDYKISNFSVRAPGEGLQSYLGVSVDYYGDSGTSNVPLHLTYNVRSGNIVYNAGIGVDFRAGDDTGTSLGGRVGIAYEFGNAGRLDKPIFVQANYFLSDKSTLSGFGVYVGYRF